MKTERLFIRPLANEDWKAVKTITDDFSAGAYAQYDLPFPSDEKESRELTERFVAGGGFYAVFADENMIGYVCFHAENGAYDLGYCFHSAFQGKGYAFEACDALMGYLAQTQGAKHFTAGTAINNLPSVKLLRKLGFSMIGTEPVSFYKDADGADIVFTGGMFEKRV